MKSLKEAQYANNYCVRMLYMLILLNSHKSDKIIVLTLCQALFLITFIIPFYEEKNLRLREVKQLSQDDTVSVKATIHPR